MGFAWKSRIVAGMVGAVALGFPGVVFAQSAQSAPPDPPYALVFGTATGATEGWPVVAFVVQQTTTANCGWSTVKDDQDASDGAAEGIVYGVSINAESQTPGCGAAGRQVRIYFPGLGGAAGAFATPSFTIDESFQGGKRQDLVLGAPLTNRLYAPGISANP